MFLALATENQPLAAFAGLPTLCGVYASAEEAASYCAWENARADFSVYYVADADSRTQCAVIGDDLAIAYLHEADGEWHWSVEYPSGDVAAYGADFHATRGEAWQDMARVWDEVTSEAFRRVMARA